MTIARTEMTLNDVKGSMQYAALVSMWLAQDHKVSFDQLDQSKAMAYLFSAYLSGAISSSECARTLAEKNFKT